MPSAEDIQRVYEHYAAAWSRLDLDAVLGLFAPDAVVHDPVDGPRSKAWKPSASTSRWGLASCER